MCILNTSFIFGFDIIKILLENEFCIAYEYVSSRESFFLFKSVYLLT